MCAFDVQNDLGPFNATGFDVPKPQSHQATDGSNAEGPDDVVAGMMTVQQVADASHCDDADDDGGVFVGTPGPPVNIGDGAVMVGEWRGGGSHREWSFRERMLEPQGDRQAERTSGGDTRPAHC